MSSSASGGHPAGVPSSRRAERDAALLEVLEESRRRGLLGGTDLQLQVAHARAMGRCADGAGRVLDLGSGGGLPGLVLASDAQGRSEFTLLDSSARRCRFLSWAVDEMDLGVSVEVVHGRAEEVARRDGYRGTFGTVVSRSFGAPGVTAECARGFLAPDGLLVVSEPPEAGRSRWPEDDLAALGYGPARECRQAEARFAVLPAVGPPPEDVPRRSGMPAKRPRF